MKPLSQELFDQSIRESIEIQPDPVRWWYLSYIFDKDKSFAGACIVEAKDDLFSPHERVLELGIKPKNSTVHTKREIPEERIPTEDFRNRLLTADEVRAMWPDIFEQHGLMIV